MVGFRKKFYRTSRVRFITGNAPFRHLFVGSESKMNDV